MRIPALFAEKKAFIGYLTAGDGGIKKTLAAALALIDGGINLLEIGMPFSDPIADGTVIERAAARAIASGINFSDIIWLIKEIRLVSDIPLILFSYLNPLLANKPAQLFSLLKQNGLDGVLIVDTPIEEAQKMQRLCQQNQLNFINVISPTTPIERIKLIANKSDGFLYYACRKGTTGMRTNLPDDLVEKIEQIKSITKLPIAVGFGISNNQMVNDVLSHAHGVVIGSLFVKAIEDGCSFKELTQLAQTLTEGMKYESNRVA